MQLNKPYVWIKSTIEAGPPVLVIRFNCGPGNTIYSAMGIPSGEGDRFIVEFPITNCDETEGIIEYTCDEYNNEVHTKITVKITNAGELAGTCTVKPDDEHFS